MFKQQEKTNIEKTNIEKQEKTSNIPKNIFNNVPLTLISISIQMIEDPTGWKISRSRILIQAQPNSTHNAKSTPSPAHLLLERNHQNYLRTIHISSFRHTLKD